MIVVLSYSVCNNRKLELNLVLEVGCCSNKTLKHVAQGLGSRQKLESFEEPVGESWKAIEETAGESWQDREKIGSADWKKSDPYVMEESLTALLSAAMWKIAHKPNKLVNLATEISWQNVEGASWFL